MAIFPPIWQLPLEPMDIGKERLYFFTNWWIDSKIQPLSTIIEAELVDDGGYIYSLFDILDSSEFLVDPFVVNTAQFKKIFQIAIKLYPEYLARAKRFFFGIWFNDGLSSKGNAFAIVF